jgi:hypothetical protein
MNVEPFLVLLLRHAACHEHVEWSVPATLGVALVPVYCQNNQFAE